MRRIVPAASIARSLSSTVSIGRSASRAISSKGSVRNPAMRSSETERMRALIGSPTSVGTAEKVVASTVGIPKNIVELRNAGYLKRVEGRVSPTLLKGKCRSSEMTDGARRAPSPDVPRRPATRSPRTAPLTTAALALSAFVLIAALDEPTALDRAVYEWARRHHDRRLELAQWPIELIGLPGVY